MKSKTELNHIYIDEVKYSYKIFEDVCDDGSVYSRTKFYDKLGKEPEKRFSLLKLRRVETGNILIVYKEIFMVYFSIKTLRKTTTEVTNAIRRCISLMDREKDVENGKYV